MQTDLTGNPGADAAGPQADAAGPTVTGISETLWSSDLFGGEVLRITVGFSEPVTVMGDPELTLSAGAVATYDSGSGTDALVFDTIVGGTNYNFAVTQFSLPGGASIEDAAGNRANLLLSGVSQSAPQPEQPLATLTAIFTNVLRGAPNSAFATSPTIQLSDGSSVPNPMYQDAQQLPGLAFEVTSGLISMDAAVNTVEHWADATTSVVTIAYQFFTNATPDRAGYDYLINSASNFVSDQAPFNPDDLNSAYYARFNEVNRYINFAVDLGKYGQGSGSFGAIYGPLDLQDAVSKAYTALFGFAPSPGKIAAILDAEVGPNETRADYFAAYGGDGLNGIGTKAAAVGWLMAVAVQGDLGVYAATNDHWLQELANEPSAGSLNLFLDGAAMNASQATAVETQLQQGATLAVPLHVADHAANIAANLDSLQALAILPGPDNLASMGLTDNVAPPVLAITATQAGADTAALSLIESVYVLTVTGTTAQFNGLTIQELTTPGSELDLTDLNPNSLTAAFTENAAGTQGTLMVSDGTHAGTVTLVGQLAPANFSGQASAAGFVFHSDAGAGTEIGWT